MTKNGGNSMFNVKIVNQKFDNKFNSIFIILNIFSIGLNKARTILMK